MELKLRKDEEEELELCSIFMIELQYFLCYFFFSYYFCSSASVLLPVVLCAVLVLELMSVTVSCMRVLMECLADWTESVPVR